MHYSFYVSRVIYISFTLIHYGKSSIPSIFYYFEFYIFFSSIFLCASLCFLHSFLYDDQTSIHTANSYVFLGLLHPFIFYFIARIGFVLPFCSHQMHVCCYNCVKYIHGHAKRIETRTS